MTDKQTDYYGGMFKAWAKQIGRKPTEGELATVHALGARPGKQAMANAMYLRPCGATTGQVCMVVGAPQLNKMRALRDGDKVIKQLPANKTAEGHTVYRIELTAKGENKVKAVTAKLAVDAEAKPVKVKRKVKSLMQFSPRESKAGVTVKVHGQKKLIKGAFIGQLRNGRQGVYVEDKAAGKTVVRHSKQYKKGGRGGWHDYPIRKLYGPSVGGAYSTARIQEIMEKMIRETFADRLAHEIAYLSR